MMMMAMMMLVTIIIGLTRPVRRETRPDNDYYEHNIIAVVPVFVVDNHPPFLESHQHLIPTKVTFVQKYVSTICITIKVR